jgi:4-amino-4-deoxy-L-arabinose transferase
MSLTIFFALASVFLFYKKQDRLSLVVLCLAAMVLRYHYITLDAFLNDWDERFHALVAKNMMTQPFAP